MFEVFADSKEFPLRHVGVFAKFLNYILSVVGSAGTWSQPYFFAINKSTVRDFYNFFVPMFSCRACFRPLGIRYSALLFP